MNNLIIFVLVIAAVWGLFLLPSLIEARREAPLMSTQRYDEVSARLSIAQTGPQAAAARAATNARRRRTLAIVGVLALGTLVAAVMTSSVWVLVAHLLVDAFLAWYIAMLVQLRRQQQHSSLVRAHSQVPAEIAEVRVIAG